MLCTTYTKIKTKHWQPKLPNYRASLVAQLGKNPPAMRETRVRSLGQKDPLEKEMATHSRTLAWKNPVDGGSWWAPVHGVAKWKVSSLTT